MQKRILLAIIFCLFFISFAHAQEAPALQKLSDNVYAYINIKNATPADNSFGANCGVVIGEESVLVIDTLVSAKHAKRLIEQIREISDKPIKFAVNTHPHLDHAWGNSEFAKLGTIIIGQRNMPFTKEYAAKALGYAENFGLSEEAMEGTTAKLPDILIDDTLTIDLGGVSVELNYLGHSHTIDSITALVKEDNILFTGDIIFNKYHPFLAEGNISSWIKILEKIEKTTAAKIIVPGHGPAALKKDIAEMAEYLKTFDKQAKKLCKKKTQEDSAEITEKLMALLPMQDRNELQNLVEMNLKMKYLPQEDNN